MPLTLHGVSVSIQTEGKELEPYKVEIQGSVVSCWIASESGKMFSVHWERTCPGTIRAEMKMDGRVTNRLLQRPTSVKSQLEGLMTDGGGHRPYVFAPLVLTDDDELLANSLGNNDLGVIELSFRTALGSEPCYNGVAIKVDDIGPVHERSKKAGAHNVSFGKVVPGPPPMFFTPIGLAEHPFVTFQFRYRPLELLQANDIAPLLPRSTSGPKRGADDEDENRSARKRPRSTQEVDVKPVIDIEYDDEDEEALEKQLAVIRRRLRDKRAKKTGNVKREKSAIPPSYADDDIIDLTV